MKVSPQDRWTQPIRGRVRRRPTGAAYLHALYRVNPDFVYSVSREFVSNCRTPILVMPDDVAPHPYQVCEDILALAPNAQATIYPWKDSRELKAKAVERLRGFRNAHKAAAAR